MELDVFSLKISRKGISPLIATVLVMLFGVTTLGIALGIVNPAFRRMKDTSIVNDEFRTLETLNTAIKEVASESDGSRRIVPITITDGTLRVNSAYDWLYFEYEPSEAMDISGTKGDIRIEHGLEFADYFNYYAEGSTATPTWTNTSGQAVVSSGAYSITNGTSYHNVSGPLENWKFSATITNVSGSTGGQVFALPTNPESLVLFLPFDNASGSVAYDYSGNRNNGTLTNMNTTGNSTSGWQDAANCKAGGSCLRFDGVNDKVTMLDSISLSVMGNLSISLWTKPGSVTGWQYVLSKYWDYYIALSGTQIQFGVFNAANAWRYAYKSAGASIGTWVHVVGVYDTSDPVSGCKIYINGIISSDRQDVADSIRDTAGSVTLGTSSGGGGDWYNGTIDEVMIFNRSLTDAEVKALYETSTKKLDATGTQAIATKTNPAIVLSNPAGKTTFDDVTVTGSASKLTLLVPFTNIELNGTLRLTKGEHKIQIRHMETNTTTSRPIVELTAV